MVKRENESDHRLIRYLISLLHDADITNGRAWRIEIGAHPRNGVMKKVIGFDAPINPLCISTESAEALS